MDCTYQETVAARRRVLGDEHPATAAAAYELAAAQVLEGKLDEALSDLEFAFAHQRNPICGRAWKRAKTSALSAVTCGSWHWPRRISLLTAFVRHPPLEPFLPSRTGGAIQLQSRPTRHGCHSKGGWGQNYRGESRGCDLLEKSNLDRGAWKALPLFGGEKNSMDCAQSSRLGRGHSLHAKNCNRARKSDRFSTGDIVFATKSCQS